MIRLSPKEEVFDTPACAVCAPPRAALSSLVCLVVDEVYSFNAMGPSLHSPLLFALCFLHILAKCHAPELLVADSFVQMSISDPGNRIFLGAFFCPLSLTLPLSTLSLGGGGARTFLFHR